MSEEINNKVTKPIRIDAGWHKILKVVAAEQQTSIRDLVEGILAEHSEELIGN